MYLSAQQAGLKPPKPRIVITADPELDDNDTLIRAMLYLTDFDLQGLVYQESTFHWKGDGKGTTQYVPSWGSSRLNSCPTGCANWRWPSPDHEAFIDHIVDAYASSYANLKVHNPNYPEPSLVKSKIKWGNVDFPGDFSKDTDGSNLIKSLLLDDQPAPVYVTAQGGQSTIARALRSIYQDYHDTTDWASVRDKVSHKLIIIPWGDQDGLYAKYIKPNWPGVDEWALAMVEYGYGIRSTLSATNKVYVSGAWTRANILDRGSLGALYRVWQDGIEMDPTDTFGFGEEKLRRLGITNIEEKDAFISEGDTPTYLNLLNNGLRAQHGYWGGWGGIRKDGLTQMPTAFYELAPATPLSIDDPGIPPYLAPAGKRNPNIPNPHPPPPANHPPDFGRRPPIPARTLAINNSFFAAAQNDFAARLKWSVTPNYKDANHEPHVSIKGPLEVTAKPGNTLTLEGTVSDPDHNAVTVTWWQYNDAGTYPGNIHISNPNSLKTSIGIPADARPGDTIHLILEGTDNGTPALTRYQRVVITIE
ncbi:MAG: DUF1593 domain-containing protein [Acidobacteria bacterium]|nr:DUF1593 domain-containing protein [Acidobacteriota bacterium]